MLSCLAGSAQAHNCPSIPMPPPILNLLSLAKMEHSAHSFPVDLTRYLFSWKMLHIILRPLCPTLKNVALTHVSRENVLQAVNDIHIMPSYFQFSRELFKLRSMLSAAKGFSHGERKKSFKLPKHTRKCLLSSEPSAHYIYWKKLPGI